MDPRPDELPLDRIRNMGLRSVGVADLLSVALGIPLADCVSFVAHRNLNHLGDMSPADLKELAGLDTDEALAILSAIEVGRRSGLSGKGERRIIRTAKDVYQAFAHLADEPKEHFCALFLAANNGILATRTIHVGTINMSVVGPREVFREAIRENAAQLIVVHNHPSGDPTPSQEDIQVTEHLRKIGEMLDIPLQDHVIVGHHTFASLRTLGYL